MMMVIASMAFLPTRSPKCPKIAAPKGGQKTDAVGAERSDRTQRGVGQWKEQLVKDERACGSVDQKVVPLDRRADDA
jgi:hypothetical protein